MQLKKHPLLLLSLMALSPLSMAQNYRSSIDGISLNGVYNTQIEDWGNAFCNTYKKDPQTNADDSDALDACYKGDKAARHMAEKFARGQGQFLGCMDGLQQGIFQGYLSTKDPSYEMLESAKKKFKSTEMKTAISRANNEAQSRGKSVAAGTIISRFRSALGTGQTPDDSYSYPEHNFTGYDYGYDDDGLSGSVNEVSDLGWVSKGARGLELIEANSVYGLYRSGNYGANNLCSRGDVLWKDRKNFSLWDYFHARAELNFKNLAWKNCEASLDYFLNNLTGTLQNGYYDAIKGKTMPVQVKVQEERVIKDEYGNIIDVIPAVYETRIKPVPGRDKNYYKNIYRQAFKEACRYYNPNYFGSAFVQAHRDKQSTGEVIGSLIGENVAGKYADMIAYNNKYKQDSIAAFNLEWRKNYDFEWNQIWDQFAKGTMVEVNAVEFSGSKDDDIFKAGESVSATLALTNLGLEPGNIDVIGRSRDFVSIKPAQSFEAPSSDEFQIDTSLLAEIRKDAKVRSDIVAGVQISGANDFSILTDKKNQVLTINEDVEIDAVKAIVNAGSGGGNVQVTLINPTSLETSALPMVRVNLGKFGVYEIETLKIQRKGSRVVNIPLTGLDPLELIFGNGDSASSRGKVQGTVEVLMNGKVLHSAKVSADVGEKKLAIAKYFNDLVNDPTTNSGRKTREQRIQELIDIMLSQAKKENNMQDRNWKKTRFMQNSIVGKVSLVHSSQLELSEEAKAYYEQLGQIFNTISEDIGWFWFERRAFKKELQKFAPGVEIRKKKK